jgi:hypothetical protein
MDVFGDVASPFSMFLSKNPSKYIKIFGTELISLESIFQYESNNTNYV